MNETVEFYRKLCDLVQVWDRKKRDYDNINNESFKINAHKKLDFCKIGSNLALFQINHILRYKSKIRDYAEDLGGNFLSK